jgi:peptidoglycan hydrolase-like protein with peptidoglycan-binding domain
MTMRNILLVLTCSLFLFFAVSITAAQEGAAPAEQPPVETKQPAATAEQPPAAAEQPAATAVEKPAPAAEEKAHPVKSMAMDADKIKAVQEALNKAGAKLKVDGKMGKMTRRALKKFQKRNDLKVTGKLDAETLAKLGIQ